MDDMPQLNWDAVLLDEFKEAAKAAFESGEDYFEFHLHTYRVHEAWFIAEHLSAHFNQCFGTVQ